MSLASECPAILNVSEAISSPQGSRPCLTLQNYTFLLLLIVPLFSTEGQSFSGGLSENVVHVLLILCRTLEVELCIHLLPGLLTLYPQKAQLQILDCMACDKHVESKENSTFGKDVLLY